MVVKNVKNYKRGTRTPPTEGGSRSLGVYIDDNSFESFYKTSVTAPNPVAQSLKDSEYGNESEHAQPYVNQFKTVDIMFSTTFPRKAISWNPTTSSGFGNWKTASGIKVHKNVFLQMEDPKIEVGIEQTFENLWDKVLSNKIVSFVDKAATDARMLSSALSGNSENSKAGKGFPKYRNVMVLKDVSTLNLPSTLAFTFNYGSAGLYSCEQEVVRPILALAKLYAPQNVENFEYGNAPTTEYGLTIVGRNIISMIKTAAQSVDTALSSGKSNDDNDGGGGGESLKGLTSMADEAAKFLTGLQEQLYEAINNAAKDILDSGKYRTLTLRVGRFVLPSMLPATVKFTFDFTQVDEYGFPYKGTITFDGLQTPTVGDNSMFIDPASGY